MPLVAWLVAAALAPGCDNTAPRDPRTPTRDWRTVHRPADDIVEGKIRLGSASLTAGITGTGPVTPDELAAWLADPINHEPLDVMLPVGLRTAEIPADTIRDNPLTRAKIELGRQLFFELRISNTGFSCGHCHPPEDYFAHFGHNLDPTLKHVRTVPVVFNRILSRRQMWDGRAASLEEQAVLPIEHAEEMASDPDACVRVLREIRGYRMQFERIFGQVSIEGVRDALAAFERCIVTLPSPYDMVRESERLASIDAGKRSDDDRRGRDSHAVEVSERPMSPAAIRGETLFFSDRVGCARCHRGANFTDEAFHNIGIGMNEDDPDLGRYLVTGEAADYGAFKTPTLRNVEHTAPYMHRGQIETLAGVVRWYAQGGFANKGLSPLIQPIALTAEEQHALVEFLKALSSPVTPVERGRLPAD